MLDVVLGHRDLHRVGRRVEERRVELAAAVVVRLEPRDGLRGDVEARSRVGFRRALRRNKNCENVLKVGVELWMLDSSCPLFRFLGSVVAVVFVFIKSMSI